MDRENEKGITVKVRRGTPIEKSLRILKRKLENENTLEDVRERRYYRKPSEIKREIKSRKKKMDKRAQKNKR